MTPVRSNVAEIVPTTLFFLGGSPAGGIVPVRRTMGVCPGEAARALRERAVAITVGSSVAGECPASPCPPTLPDTTFAAGDPMPMTIVELGLLPATPCAR